MSKSNIHNAKENAIKKFLHSQQEFLSTTQLVKGILNGDKSMLAKAITLLESKNLDHITIASEVVNQCLKHSGNSIRIGITGVPGVGKSTFIEALGSLLTQKGIKVAVLAVDPSSSVHKGSILGDKTRMESLSTNDLAFIRPSPSSGTLGGVANTTRESILVCEAAGFEVIIVETVGVGQSEYLVKEMVDFFLLLMLSGAGDEIQGIKRGIMEMADALFVNKADGENKLMAEKAAQAYANVLHLFPAREDNWVPKTGVCSAINHEGISDIWNIITDFKSQQIANNEFEKRRQKQSKSWLMNQIDNELKAHFYTHPLIKENLNAVISDVVNGEKTPYAGSKELMDLFLGLKLP